MKHRAQLAASLERIIRLLETGRHELAHTEATLALRELNTCKHGHHGELVHGRDLRCNACRRERRKAGLAA